LIQLPDPFSELVKLLAVVVGVVTILWNLIGAGKIDLQLLSLQLCRVAR
jgi:hypothetical protein